MLASCQYKFPQFAEVSLFLNRAQVGQFPAHYVTNLFAIYSKIDWKFTKNR